MLAENAQPVCLELRAVMCAMHIGGTSLELWGASGDDVRVSSNLEQFRRSPGTPDVTIDVDWTARVRSHSSTPIFDSGAAWTISRNGDDFIFDFSSHAIDLHPYKRLVVNSTFTRAQLLLSREALESHRPILPLEYPADELLVTNYLAANALGVEVHGCGIIDAETGGHLLLGHSGAGKSTTAHLWQLLRNPEILSDDRLILRIENGELWMHGTPWHGEGRFASPAKSRVNSIFILQHGERNEFTKLPPSRAVGELFARSFPPFHSSTGLERTIEFLARVVAIAPCYEFSFVPDASAVNAILEFNHVADY